MKFRIRTILWVFALLASAMATFGTGGLLPALVVFSFWALVFGQRRLSLLEWVMIFVIVLGFLDLLLPAVQSAHKVAKRNTCLNNLKQIAYALANYCDQHGNLPPAHVLDDDGRPIHSWRYLILPQLEGSNLYKQIRQDESWDSTNNKPFTDLPFECMQCSASPYPPVDNFNSYFSVVGPHTAWPGSRGLKLAEIKDGPGQTILLIEAGSRGIGWAEPKDFSFDEAVDLLTQPASLEIGDGHWVENGFFYQPSKCRHVLFVNSNFKTLHGPLSREMAIALLTIDGGEEIDMSELDRLSQPVLNYSRIYSLSVFVLLSLLPIVKFNGPAQR